MPADSASDIDDRRLLARFWQSASGFWWGRSAWRAWLLLALMMGTVLLQLLTTYLLNFWNRDFFNAIGDKDAAEVGVQAMRFVPLFSASLFLALLTVWGRLTTQRQWRQWLSNHLYDYWLENGRFRRLRFVEGDHQTPESRIAEDAKVATELPVDLVLGLFSSIITAITFIGVLWSVGDSLVIDAFGLNLTIHGYLVIAVVAYSLLSTASMMLIGHRVTRVMEENKRAEAQLRAKGTHLRESGEGTALQIGRFDGRAIMGEALQTVIVQALAYCWQVMRMTFIWHTNFLLTPILGLLLCTPKYLAGTMTLGEVVQAAAAFVIVQTAFNWFTESYGKLADWKGSANRVASLLVGLDQVGGAGQPANLAKAGGTGEAELAVQGELDPSVVPVRPA